MLTTPAAVTLSTAEALEEYGRQLAAQLPDFTVLALVGELGAGKTTLMKGLATGWGVARPDEVTSPTYTLIHEYRRASGLLYHLDLYRIETGAQLETLGLEDLFLPPAAGGRKLVAIEWAERALAHLPRPYLRLDIAIAPTERRCLTLAWVT